MQRSIRKRRHNEWLEDWIMALLKYLSKFLRIYVSESALHSAVQFIKFGMVGVSNTLLSYCTYAGTVWIFQHKDIFPKKGYLIAKLGAFFISATWSYCLNSYFTFRDTRKKTIKEWIYGLLKTFASYSFTGLGCSTLILMLLVGELHLSPYLAQVINLMIGIPLNFTLNKLWVFRNASR